MRQVQATGRYTPGRKQNYKAHPGHLQQQKELTPTPGKKLKPASRGFFHAQRKAPLDGAIFDMVNRWTLLEINPFISM
ncbi:hypothetical protein LQ759_21495 [Serratia marcescens]|nr:hypothetical protein [Serratia marcescens]